MTIPALTGWTANSAASVIASFFSMDAGRVRFLLLVFVIKDIAQEFGTAIPEVTFAILLTLAMRPIGAFRSDGPPIAGDGRPTLMSMCCFIRCLNLHPLLA